jgi:hypothetical protein
VCLWGQHVKPPYYRLFSQYSYVDSFAAKAWIPKMYYHFLTTHSLHSNKVNENVYILGGKVSCQMTEMLEISLRRFKETQNYRSLFITQFKMASEIISYLFHDAISISHFVALK